MGRFRAGLLVASMVLGALFGAHLGPLASPSGYFRLGSVRNPRFLEGRAQPDRRPGLLCIAAARNFPNRPGYLVWADSGRLLARGTRRPFFARVGCYMKGCCWGTPIQEGHPFFGLSVKLIRNSLLTLHPVQLYSAAVALAIFCILLALRRRSKTPGMLAALFLLLHAAARFFLEFFRGDTPTLFAGLTLSQGVCILLFVAGSFLLVLLLRDPRQPTS